VAARQWVRPLNLLAKKSGDAASLDPRLKAAESLLGDGIRSILKQVSDDQVKAVFTQIRAAIGERKMVWTTWIASDRNSFPRCSSFFAKRSISRTSSISSLSTRA
jgi:hypothetical protein